MKWGIMSRIKYLEIEAKDNYSFGLKLGSQLAPAIKKRWEKNQAIYHSGEWRVDDNWKEKSQQYFLYVQKHFPRIGEEIMGMSKGAGIDRHDLMLMMTEEELVVSRRNRCSTLSFRTRNGELLLGHNEDWLPEYRHNGLFIVKATINRKKWIALGYMGSLAGTSAGLNEYGLAYSGNSLPGLRSRIGVPRSVQMRAFLDAGQVSELINIDLSDSTIGGNTMAVWRDKMIIDEEEFWHSQGVLIDNNYLVHTNHPVIMAKKNKNKTNQESVDRYDRIVEIIQKEKVLSLKTLKKVLRDHAAGICSHGSRKNEGIGVTIASVIINPSAGWLDVAWTNPCRHDYQRFNL